MTCLGSTLRKSGNSETYFSDLWPGRYCIKDLPNPVIGHVGSGCNLGTLKSTYRMNKDNETTKDNPGWNPEFPKKDVPTYPVPSIPNPQADQEAEIRDPNSDRETPGVPEQESMLVGHGKQTGDANSSYKGGDQRPGFEEFASQTNPATGSSVASYSADRRVDTDRDVYDRPEDSPTDPDEMERSGDKDFDPTRKPEHPAEAERSL